MPAVSPLNPNAHHARCVVWPSFWPLSWNLRWPVSVPRPLYALCMLCVLLNLGGCGVKLLMPGEMVREEVAPAKARQVVEVVRAQIGVRYIWGGNSPKGFDCSGLIWWAYRQHGINVPRVTRDQAVFGRGVSTSQMRAGDILVFHTSAGLHTGLYAGNGAFIHAPSSGKRVRQDSVRSSYWQPRLKGVRRVYTGG